MLGNGVMDVCGSVHHPPALVCINYHTALDLGEKSWTDAFVWGQDGQAQIWWPLGDSNHMKVFYVSGMHQVSLGEVTRLHPYPPRK